MLRKIEKYISAHELLDKSKTHIVTLSGGADSVCLLLAMRELGYKVHAAHCNFHLRGDESDRDEQFCESLCHRENIEFHKVHFDTKSYSALRHVSIEMAARELRYRYFEQLRHAINAEDILVAHHQDDSIETFLMNLMRGTGIHGLQGIKPRNGHIVRPLLCVKRCEIEAWLSIRKQDFVTDSTNLENDVIRNKIRLDLIPLLKTIYPTATDNIQSTIERMNEASKMFDAQMTRSVYEVTAQSAESLAAQPSPLYVNIAALLSQPSPEYTLFTILSPYGFTPSQVENIMNCNRVNVGSRWVNGGFMLLLDRENFILSKLDETEWKEKIIPESGTYIIKEYKETFNNKETGELMECSITCKLRVKEYEITDEFKFSRCPDCINVDADKVKFPLRLRKIANGDRFSPLGMKGTKLVSDYLTDRKRSRLQKDSQLILLDSEGKVVWLVGERPDDRCKITPSSRRTYEIEFKKEKENK